MPVSKCNKCGSANKESSDFCAKCGARLNEMAPKPQVVLSPVSPQKGGPLISTRMIQLGPLEEAKEMALADPEERFRAFLIDAGVLLPWFAFLVMFRMNHFTLEECPYWIIIAAYLNLLIVGPIQIIKLSKNGQSIGKQFIKIRIVRMADGEKGGFVTNVIFRTFIPNLLSLIPLFALADILFIYSKNRRCIHDFIAGTCVVKAV